MAEQYQESHFSFAKRAADKVRARKEDEERLARGANSPAELAARNGFFSALDPSKARIVARRAKVRIED
jgi:hypothetical protein